MLKAGRYFWLGALGVLGLFGIGFSIHTGRLTRRLAARARSPKAPALPPITVLRPIKSGTGDVVENVRRLSKACRPNDQIIVGLGSEEECQNLAGRVGCRNGVIVEFVVCRPRLHANPKVSKLVQMEAMARHERHVITDAETRVTAGFLDAFRSDWETSGAAAISAPYQARPRKGIWDRLDHAASFLTFWPGCFMLRERGRVDFLLGACMGVRATALRGIGGWAALGDSLADDHELGARLASSGHRVALSHAVVEMDGDGLGFSGWLLHQHRVARTHRLLAPRGYSGLPITFGLAAFLWTLFLRPAPFKVLTAILLAAVRWWGIGGSVRALEAGGRRVRVPLWAMVVASLIEPLFWFAGLFPFPVWWAGRWLDCGEKGKIRASVRTKD